MSAASTLPEVGLTDDLAGRVRVDVGIVEEAEAELVPEQAPHGDIDPCLVDLAGADEVDDDLGARLAPELVDAGLDHLERPLVRAQVLDAPGAGGERRTGDHRVRQQSPVGADDAVEPIAPRSSPVITPRLKPNPTSSYSVPTGIP